MFCMILNIGQGEEETTGSSSRQVLSKYFKLNTCIIMYYNYNVLSAILSFDIRQGHFTRPDIISNNYSYDSAFP